MFARKYSEFYHDKKIWLNSIPHKLIVLFLYVQKMMQKIVKLIYEVYHLKI